MEHISQVPFIVAAYVAAFAVVGSLIVWVTLDFRAQRRALAELEAKGLSRRSAFERREPRLQQAKEEA